jgi:VanZ family protein
LAIVGSLLPPQQLKHLTYTFSDKLIHIVYYATLTFFWLNSTKNKTRQQTLKVVLSVFLMGVILEFLQVALPINRTMDVLDVVCNSLGISIALLMARFLKLLGLNSM